MISEARIWCSNLMLSSSNVLSVFYDFPTPRPKDHWTSRYLDGGRIRPSEFPNRMKARKALESTPPIFLVAGRVIVCGEKVKSLLEQFNLGQTHFHPVDIDDPWEIDEYEGPFFILNIAERRSCVLPIHCERTTQRPSGNWTVLPFVDDLDLAIRSDFAPDVDLWLDPSLHDTIFLTAELAEAIRDARIRNFKVYPCREVAGSA